jgi:hypoxanthine phosphoribosyltransferase
MLSHALGIPLIVDSTKITNNTLIVDDIADTGATLQRYGKNTRITMYYHKQSTFIPHFWMYEKTDQWIKFPWETEEL